MAYSFRVDNGNWYTEANYRTFIVNEVRPKVSNSGTFTIDMQENHPNGPVLTMTLNRSDLYITHLNGVLIPQNLINYGNSNLKINQFSIDAAFNDALTFNGQLATNTHNTLRVLPFLFAEAARFPIVNYAVGRVFRINATYKWSSFRGVIRSWQVLCNFAIQNNMLPPDAVMGGGGKFVPVEPGVIRAYNAQPNTVPIPVPAGAGM